MPEDTEEQAVEPVTVGQGLERLAILSQELHNLFKDAADNGTELPNEQIIPKLQELGVLTASLAEWSFIMIMANAVPEESEVEE